MLSIAADLEKQAITISSGRTRIELNDCEAQFLIESVARQLQSLKEFQLSGFVELPCADCY